MGKIGYLRTPLQIHPYKPTIPVAPAVSMEQLLLEQALFRSGAYNMSENSGYDSFSRSFVSLRILIYLIISEKGPKVVINCTT